MKGALLLEWIGMDSDNNLRQVGERPIRKPWCAQILALTRRNFERRFLTGDLDLSQSNSAGSRGVRLRFILESGRLYEWQYHESWRSSVRAYGIVDEAGGIMQITKEGAERWLSAG